MITHVFPISFKSFITRYAFSGSSRSAAYFLKPLRPASDRLYTINGGYTDQHALLLGLIRV